MTIPPENTAADSGILPVLKEPVVIELDDGKIYWFKPYI